MHFKAQKGRNETDEAYQKRIDEWIESLEVNGEGSVILPLEWPIAQTADADGEQLHELTIKRPKGADRRSLDISTAPQKIMLELLARLTGLTNKHVDKLDEADIDRAELIIANFS